MFQIIYRTGEEEYQTREILISDNQHKIVQEALKKGDDFIIIPNKATIKRTSIASINEADRIDIEYKRVGIREQKKLVQPQTGFKTIKFSECKECKEQRIVAMLKDGKCYKCQNQ